MKNPSPRSPLVLAATLAVVFLGSVRAEEVPSTIKFSDPSKPGTVKVILAHGDLRVQGVDSAGEVTVKTDAKATNRPRKDGMRVLTAASSFALSEKENVVVLDAMADGWGGGGSSDFRLTVPRNTSVIVGSKWGGDVTCTNISGDIEINAMNGEIRLDEISGGATVETLNGEIRANFRELHANKPLTFSSTNGEVVLRVPGDAKANIRLRTQNGSVLTDFDETALVTKTETTPRPASTRRGPGGRTVSVIGPDVKVAISEATKTVVQVARETKEAIREGADAARSERDAARAERDRQRETDRARAEVDRARAEAERAGRVGPVPPVPPTPGMPAMPAMPAMPTITGGKLVTGTLNGGGPEISVSTMNGDVTLRKLEPIALKK